MEYKELIGIIGYACVAIGLLHKNDNTTKTLIITACLTNAIYFSLQGLYISSFIVFLTGARIAISLISQSKIIGSFFIILSVSTPFWIPSSDWISAITGIFGTLAVFWFNGLPMRILLLLASFVWVVNNYVYGAWIAFYGELIAFVFCSVRIMLLVQEEKISKTLKD